MVDLILDEFKKLVKIRLWMDAFSREKALEKVT
jgi:hypothetical protein